MSEQIGEAVVVVRTDESQVDGVGSGKRAGSGFGSGFLGSLKGLALAGGIAAAGAAVSAQFIKGLNFDAGQKKIQAQLGLTETQSAEAGRVAGALYSDNYGDGLGDVQDAVGTVIGGIKGMRQASEADLSAASEAALQYADVFDTDISSAVTSASQLINQGLAKDAVGAFDLLTAASQKVPAALRQDVFDATNEYSQFFAAIGADGSQAFEVLAGASDRGVIGIDKAGDAVKEFTIRATDLQSGSKEAYDAIGLNAEEMANKVLAGGDTAAGATQSIIDGLLKIDDPAKQAQAAIGLFGTPLEDLGTKNIPDFLQSLQGTGDAFSDVAGATADAADTMYDTPLVQLSALWRSFQGTLMDFTNAALPPILDGFSAVSDLIGNEVVPIIRDTLAPVFATAGEAVSTQLVPALQTAGEFLTATLGPVVMAVVDVFQTQLLPAFLSVGEFIYGTLYPAILTLVSAVASNLAPIFATLANVMSTQIVPTFGRVVEVIRTQLVPALAPLISKIVSVIGFLLRLASAILGTVIPPILKLAGFIISLVVPRIVQLVAIILKVINTILNWGGTLLKVVGQLGSFGSAIVKVVKSGLDLLFNAVRDLPGRIIGLGSKFLSAGKAIITQFVAGLKGAGGLVSDISGNVWNALRGLLNSAIGKINRALEFTINLPGPNISVNPPDIGYLAEGTANWGGGWSWVGERGPELLNLPRGARVLDNPTSERLTGSGQSGLDYDLLAAALVAAIRGVAGDLRPISFEIPHADPEATAEAVFNRLVTAG